MNDHTTIKDKQFTFLDESRQKVIFTPRRYDPKTGHLIGVNQQGKPISVEVGSFLRPYKPVELEWD
jgi:hypothetical protein